MKVLFTLIFWGIQVFCFSQSESIVLDPSTVFIEISNRDFYIKDVQDNRSDTSIIGTLFSPTNEPQVLIMSEPAAIGIKQFYSMYLQKRDNQYPVSIQIKKLSIAAYHDSNPEADYIEVVFSFYRRGALLYTFDSTFSIESNSDHSIDFHKKNFANALRIATISFSQGNWAERMRNHDNRLNIEKDTNTSQTPADETKKRSGSDVGTRIAIRILAYTAGFSLGYLIVSLLHN